MAALVNRRAPVAPRPLEVLTAFSGALVVLAAVWGLAEARVVNAAEVWVKPVKFALSFVVFFATLAVVEERLTEAWRDGWLLRGTVGVMAVAMLGEMAYMTVMAAQGQASHFNFSTPFHDLMYSLMGLGAFLLVAGTGVFGVAVLRDRGAGFTPEMRVAVGWGFVLTFVLTLVTAFAMASMGRHVGLHPDGGAVIPLFGWSAVVGDLRPAHFLALHTMQALPLAAWALAGRGGVRAVWVAAAGWTALTAAVFAQALAGLPLIGL
jgi:hypothetical protein